MPTSEFSRITVIKNKKIIKHAVSEQGRNARSKQLFNALCVGLYIFCNLARFLTETFI